MHIKHTDGSFEYIPYFSLPANDLSDVIAPSCYSCFDYTNGLADLVSAPPTCFVLPLVGYIKLPLQPSWQGLSNKWNRNLCAICASSHIAERYNYWFYLGLPFCHSFIMNSCKSAVVSFYQPQVYLIGGPHGLDQELRQP